MEFFFKHKRWLWPLLFLIILTPFTPALDMAIEQYFYDRGNDETTHFLTSPFIEFMYSKGVWIPNIIALLALPCLLAGNLRRGAIAVILTIMIGSGFITHFILKDHWGRPRPKQIEEFGGVQTYRPYWHPNFYAQPEPSKSFVCGHCSVGFFMSIFILLGLRYRSQKMFFFGIIMTAFFGVGLSLVRMAQGGHFLTDTLFAAVIMWWTALSMNWLVWADEDLN